MRKNIMNKLLFTFLCMFMTVGSVLAEDTVTEGSTSGTGGGHGGGSDVDKAESEFWLYKESIIGIRISFYTADGSKIKSKDYVLDKYNTSAYTQYGSGSPSSKISGSYSDDWQITSGFSTISELQQIFSNSGLSINLNSIISNKNLGKNVLFSEALVSVTKMESLFTNLLGTSPEKYYNSSKEAYDLFLVWEPLGGVYHDGKNYIGIPYEIGTYVNKQYNPDGWIYGGSPSYTGWGALGRPIALEIGCSVNLDDSDKFGNDVSEKFAGNFNSRSYFNGNLTASNAGIVNTYCSYKGMGNDKEKEARAKLKDYIVDNTTSSIGIGILWYDLAIKGGDTPDIGGTCSVTYNVSSCSSDNIRYYDTTDWENCVFSEGTYDISTHKYSSSTEALTYYDSNLSSNYCDVYCIETVNGYFDSSKPSSLAGSSFTWGWSNVVSTRTCKTNGINLDLFSKNLDAANHEVVRQIAQQKLYEQFDASKWTYRGEYYSASSTEVVNFECTNEEKPGVMITDNCQKEYSKYTEIGGTCSSVDLGLTDMGDHFNHKYAFTCIVPVGGDYSCTNYRYADTATATKDGITETASIDKTVCVTTGKPTYNPVSAGNISGAVNNVNGVISELNKCYDFNDGNVLNDASSATITYVSEGGIYDYSGEMNKSTNVISHSDVRCSTTKTMQAFTKCSGAGCKNIDALSAQIYDCEGHEETRALQSSFSLQPGVYQYVLKNPSGLTLKSIHAWDLEKYTSGTLVTNWIDIGHSNFPVPYNFSSTGYTGELKITYSNLGHKSSTLATTAVDTILSSWDVDVTGTYGTWSCPYTVEPDLLKEDDNGDINVIYREIDLYSPFPDTDASNRNTGANWCSTTSCAWNNAVSTKYILNNRGVTGDELYNLEPMYTFIMTPSDIIQIRRYNDENAYTSYNGSYSGTNYNFECIEGTGTGCRSEYLTELMNMMDSYDNPGTCVSDRGVPTSIDKFDACRY